MFMGGYVYLWMQAADRHASRLTSTALSCPTFHRVVPWPFVFGAKEAWLNENKQNFRSEKQSHHDEQSKTTTTSPRVASVSKAEPPPETQLLLWHGPLKRTFMFWRRASHQERCGQASNTLAAEIACFSFLPTFSWWHSHFLTFIVSTTLNLTRVARATNNQMDPTRVPLPSTSDWRERKWFQWRVQKMAWTRLDMKYLMYIGNVVMPYGGVLDIDTYERSFCQTDNSRPDLMGTSSSSKKFKLSEDEVYRATMVNQLKVRLLTIATSRACLTVHNWQIYWHYYYYALFLQISTKLR